MGKSFTALFWNVWFDSQLVTRKTQRLYSHIDDIIASHQPDAIGLNEVLADRDTGESALLKHLESLGYQTFFAPFSPEKGNHMGGSALAYKAKTAVITTHELGPDTYARIRGYPGHTIKLIRARIPHAGEQVQVIVNYLAHLAPYNWSTHLAHHRAFRSLVTDSDLQAATIIGGDFNQFRFMPTLWGAKRHYHRATGTLLNPTWRLLGGKVPFIQANYDNIFWTKSGKLVLEDFKVLARWPSDHAPLVARFTTHNNH
ncbi:MAG TPA: endonuclease/exonuclease/phosphatase family protein [Bacillota bacterium]|nr:endonuclease/exonuclease/phosphatase family protein [Bacillota bacterium]